MEKKEKVTLREAFKSNFYMIGIAFKACPSRVVWQFAGRICEQVQRYFYRIVFWEIILEFVENGAAFRETIPFLERSVDCLAVF